jgi:hypothetical protein
MGIFLVEKLGSRFQRLQGRYAYDSREGSKRAGGSQGTHG